MVKREASRTRPLPAHAARRPRDENPEGEDGARREDRRRAHYEMVGGAVVMHWLDDMDGIPAGLRLPDLQAIEACLQPAPRKECPAAPRKECPAAPRKPRRGTRSRLGCLACREGRRAASDAHQLPGGCRAEPDHEVARAAAQAYI